MPFPLSSVVYVLFILVVFIGVGFLIWRKQQREQNQRTAYLTTAYKEGIGEAYERELKRLLFEVQRPAPEDELDRLLRPSPYIEALENVRLDQRKIAKTLPSADKPLSHIIKANTAFIMMWMAPGDSELKEIADTIKDVCKDFGINAVRADDVEHQDVITSVVLDQIRTSQYLIADLSGERPNVYYEVGYAHGIGKQPILCRRDGTRVHFDLAGYNVNSYKDITELRMMLKNRLVTMNRQRAFQ